MINILAEVSIEDFTKFIGVFSTRGLEIRGKHGSLESRVFKVKDDGTRLLLLFKWKSKEHFAEFLSNESVKDAMESSGMTAPPKFTFLELAAEFSA